MSEAIVEVRDYTIDSEWFEAYKQWAAEHAAPWLRENLDVIDFWVDDGHEPEVAGSDPAGVAARTAERVLDHPVGQPRGPRGGLQVTAQRPRVAGDLGEAPQPERLPPPQRALHDGCLSQRAAKPQQVATAADGLATAEMRRDAALHGGGLI